MEQVEIVCLANSRKLGERCVAGYDIAAGRWLRPVSNTLDGSLERRDRVCLDGGEPRLLDRLRIGLVRPAPRAHQPENWLLAPVRWRRLGVVSPTAACAFLGALATPGPDLLGGRNDRVPASDFTAQPAAASLAVVEPEALEWLIRQGSGGKRQTRACFALGGVGYDLAITDLEFELRVAPLAAGRHPRAAAGLGPTARIFFTISLGEPFDGACYKLIAAVIALPGRN